MLTRRQESIIEIVKQHGPITGERIADFLAVARTTLRPDLSVLTMAGYLDAKPHVGYFFKAEKAHAFFAGAIQKLLVRDYTAIPIVIADTNSVYDAVVMMFTEAVGTLMVVRKEKLQGVVSRKDLLKTAIGGRDTRDIPITMAMTRVPHVVYVEMDDPLLSAARKMITHAVDALPVVQGLPDGSLEVVGRVTKTTVTRAFVDLGGV